MFVDPNVEQVFELNLTVFSFIVGGGGIFIIISASIAASSNFGGRLVIFLDIGYMGILQFV